jgi:hypothetical protein
MGEDPICWSSFASATGEDGIPFPNGELVEDFSLANEVKLAPSCPNGTWLEAFAPSEFLEPDFRPRTGEYYNYTIKASINLDELSGLYIVSDEGSRVSIGVVACDSIRAGFCSPFVHEQANIREANEIEKYGHTLFAEKRITGDRHGGTHVHAPAGIVEADANSRLLSFEAQVPMIINDPGTFYVIGTLQFFMGDALGVPRYRYDVANALNLEQNERLVTYQDPAEILKVSRPVQIVSYVMVGIANAVILYLLVQTIRHLKSQVMQISQGRFLVVFLVAAMVATLSTLLFDPRSDLTCMLAYPCVFVSLQLMFAVTLGRLWRINAVISPLLRNRLQRASSSKSNACFGACCPSRRVNIRREINNTKVSVIIALCTFPQVVLQILGLVLQPSSKMIAYNDDESIGRCVCDDGVKAKKSIQMYSAIVLFLFIVILLAMAHAARQLPSLLNESSIIFDVAGTSALVAIIGVGVIAITNGDPTIDPTITYLVQVVMVLSITLNASIRIMMGKLKMVWSGQEVLVSQLVADHKQSLLSSTIRSNKNSIMHNVTGLDVSGSDLSHSFQKSSSRFRYSQTLQSGLSNDDNIETPTQESIDRADLSRLNHEDTRNMDETEPNHSDTNSNKSISSQEVWMKNAEGTKDEGERDMESGDEIAMDNQSKVKFAENTNGAPKPKKDSSKPAVIVKEGEVPSRRLTVKMLDLHDELDHVINRIMSGMQVSKERWESVRKYTERLDETFSLVQFDWEKEQSKEANRLQEIPKSGEFENCSD